MGTRDSQSEINKNASLYIDLKEGKRLYIQRELLSLAHVRRPNSFDPQWECRCHDSQPLEQLSMADAVTSFGITSTIIECIDFGVKVVRMATENILSNV